MAMPASEDEHMSVGPQTLAVGGAGRAVQREQHLRNERW